MSTGPAADLPREQDRRESEWIDEGLFARDVDGRLIRYDDATREELDQKVSLTIDGQPITVNKAVRATDEQGKNRLDKNGRVVPRPTTIYDAVSQLYGDAAASGPAPRLPGEGPAGEGSFKRMAGEAANPIPILCHTTYMDPVAVCRVCVVQLTRFRKRSEKIEVDPKLLPACQHRVADEMIVDTINSRNHKARDRIERSVKTLLELLMADHPSPCAKEQQHAGDCELEALARRFGVTGDRFPGRAEQPRDESSPVIAVNHNACILCDRCVRGCDEIKKYHVIGRTGKGASARIAFDLDSPMKDSTCRACGECSDDCPTGALTHRRVIATQLPDGDDVTVDELINHQNPRIRRAFQGVSRPFLRANIHAIKRRNYSKDQVICRQGEFGRTAFMIESGAVEIFLSSPTSHVGDRAKAGVLGGIGRFVAGLFSHPKDEWREEEDRRPFIPIDAPVALPHGKPVAPLGPGDLFGEMTCMNHYPRSATVVAVEECSVLEMLQNVLYIMQRNPSFRHDLEEDYRNRAVDNFLRTAPVFGPLRPDSAQFEALVGRLRGRKSLRRCEPGEVIFRQGAPGNDGVFLVRSGFVKVSRPEPGREQVLNYVGPGGCLGELGMLAEIAEFRDLAPASGRTADCTALGRVELIEIAPDEFRSLAPLFARERQLNELIGRLRQTVTLRRCEPGEVILRQGAPAVEGLYLVRTGFVKVAESRPGGERPLNYVGPGGYIGEIGVLSELPELRDLAPAGVRTATCTALDHVDLVRIAPGDFRKLLEDYPAVKAMVIEEARRRLESNRRPMAASAQPPIGDFLDQGLMNASSLLVLDLEKCTRCDECTKACSDTHQGVTRLIREGLRFDKFLVASSCRSCHDPYCLQGCPVGSISRSHQGEIRIADWCIGCGLCAEKCPYGNINMIKEYDQSIKAEVRKATTCDLCRSLGPSAEPSCVYACPHDAAHRMTGTELLDLVRRQEARG